MKDRLRRLCVANLALFGVSSVLAQEPMPPARPPASNAPSPAGLASFKQQLSYTLGTNIGADMRGNGVPVDLPSLMSGISDALTGSPNKLGDEKCMAVLQQFQQMMMQRAQAQMTENEKQGFAFLTENAKKPGIQVTKTGLQYRVVRQGTGATPTARDAVRCHYEGRLIDGTVFDSSYARGEPAVFPVSRVIAGWTEALQLMKVGDKWELFIPSPIAYGAEGRPPKIGPNQTLLFTIELLAIEQ